MVLNGKAQTQTTNRKLSEGNRQGLTVATLVTEKLSSQGEGCVGIGSEGEVEKKILGYLARGKKIGEVGADLS